MRCLSTEGLEREVQAAGSVALKGELPTEGKGGKEKLLSGAEAKLEFKWERAGVGKGGKGNLLSGAEAKLEEAAAEVLGSYDLYVDTFS